MKPSPRHVLTVNGGSSSIKFALFEADSSMKRLLDGKIERIGKPDAHMSVKGQQPSDSYSQPVTAPDHQAAVAVLMDRLDERIGRGELMAVGHRVVHGGPRYTEPQRITPEMVETLHQLEPFDPEHLTEEIQLTSAFFRRFPNLPQ